MAEPNSEVFFAVSADGGKSFSPNIRLADEVCPCCKTNLTVDQSGKIYAGWRQVLPGDFRHIAVATSENGGQSFSAPVIVSDDQWQINACPISGPMLVTGPGRAVDVVWFSAGKAGPAGLLTARSDDGGKTFASRRLLFEGAVPGTAAGIAENGAKRAFFGASGKLFKVRLEAPADAASELGDGELPAAVSFNGHSFVCFIKKVDGRRAIWLLKV